MDETTGWAEEDQIRMDREREVVRAFAVSLINLIEALRNPTNAMEWAEENWGVGVRAAATEACERIAKRVEQYAAAETAAQEARCSLGWQQLKPALRPPNMLGHEDAVRARQIRAWRWSPMYGRR